MRKMVRRLTAAVVMAIATIGVTASPAAAIELATDYPALSLRPGDSATFDLRLVAAARERVDVRVSEMPDGWAVRLLGAGREVSAVIADPDPSLSPALIVEVAVPLDAEPGPYDVVVEGTAPSGSYSLLLQLSVTDLASAPFELSAEFPELAGEPDQTFTFDVAVANNTGTEATFAIAAQGPAGWVVSARPAGQSQATTLTVGGGESGTLQVEATPAPDTVEGRYPIDVQITTGQGTAEGQFTAVVSGAPVMVFEPADERLSLSAEAGKSATLSLVVSNQGSAPLTDVSVSASAPTDWQVSFEPATLSAVAPGESTTVTATVLPPGGAVAGDYAVSMTAAAAGTTSSLDVRVGVETSTWWGFVAIGIIVLAFVTLGVVFRHFGRR